MRSRPIHPFAGCQLRSLTPNARSSLPARRGSRRANAARDGDRVGRATLRGIEVMYIEPEVIELR